jgi:hypothetical protein
MSLIVGSTVKKRDTLAQKNLDRKLDQLQMSQSFRSMMNGIEAKKRVVSKFERH